VAQGNLDVPVIVRGEGVYLFDADGKRYTDLSSGLVAANLGMVTSRCSMRCTRRSTGSASARRTGSKMAARSSAVADFDLAVGR